ncbi:unnamed protein product [Arabidopsis halleri]
MMKEVTSRKLSDNGETALGIVGEVERFPALIVNN